MSVLSNHARVAFELLADLLVHPSFAPAEVERLRKQTLSALDVIDRDPSYVADAVMRQLLFQGTPYSHSEDGTPESIERVTRKDLVDFHSHYYVPSQTILAVAGDITEPECLRLATRFLGPWNGADASPVQSLMRPLPLHSRQVIVIDKPDAVQTEIRVGNLGIPRSSPNYSALMIANQVLGGPASNRLFDVLRTQHGLVYGASSNLDCYSRLGAWLAKTSTRSDETIRATQMVLDEISRLRKGPIKSWELQNARDYLIGHETLEFESASQVANQVLETMLYHLPVDYWNRFPQQIRSLTPDDVLAATRKYLNTNDDVVVLVGNAAAFHNGLKKLGKARVIPIADVGRTFLEPQQGAADQPALGR